MTTRDAWIKRLENKEASAVRQIVVLEARQKEARDRRSWLRCPHRHGDIVTVQRFSCSLVVIYPGKVSFIGVVLQDGKMTTNVKHPRYSDEAKVVGRYTGPDLPPKPPEAEWAEKVLDGEMPEPEDPDEKCDFCGLSYDVPGSNEQSEGFCWCAHCDRCDAPIGDTSDLYCDTCSRESKTPEDYDEQD